MFARPADGTVTVWFEGRQLTAREHDSVAATLLAHGIGTTRTTAKSGAPRGPYCMMGACFECLGEVDGRTGVQLCLTPVRQGMRIARQSGAIAPL